MWLNNIFGGVGVGFINMLIFVIVAVFVAGMMIGRTPEFLGKKVEAKEMKLASLALLWHPLAILVGTAVACYVWATTADPGTALAWLKNPGPHGFSEMLYEFTSAAANNGSGFEGLGDNTPFWNISTGLVMLLSRYIPIIAPLALAGSLAAKPAAPETAGSLRADSATFGFTLWAVIVILGLLMFMPVAVLGPIAEHLALQCRSSLGPRGDDDVQRNQARHAVHRRHDGAARRRLPRRCCGASGGVGVPGAGGRQPDPARRRHRRRIAPDRAEVHAARVLPPAAFGRRLQRGVDRRQQLRSVESGSSEGGPGTRRRHRRRKRVSRRGRSRRRWSRPAAPAWTRTFRPAAAELQAARVARRAAWPCDRVRELIAAHTEPPTFGFLGRRASTCWS